jgi:lipopolysaccharide biosynthesis glycosyltransferase
VLGDVSELLDLPLGEAPVAARDSYVSEASEWRGAAARLTEDRAMELQRRMYRAHGWGRPALNAGVLVLDLARMRADDFTRTYLGWVERYGLHDQDIMLSYANADRVTLPPRWNALPVMEEIADPALIHWASIAKPWADQLTFGQEAWRGYAVQLQGRAGKPPAAGG